MRSCEKGVRITGIAPNGIVIYSAENPAMIPEAIANACEYLLGDTSAAVIDNDVSINIATLFSAGFCILFLCQKEK